MKRIWPFGRSPEVNRRQSDRHDGRTAARSRWWLPGLGLGTLAVAALLVLPYNSPAWDLTFLIASLLAVVILLGAALSMPRGVRSVWWLLLAFQVLTLAGQAVHDGQREAFGDQTPFPDSDDALFLIAYLPAFVALGSLIYRLNPGRDRDAWIDSSILSVAAASVIGLFLVVPLTTATGMDGWALTVAVAYTLLDLAVISCLIWLIVGEGRPQPALLLLVLSFALTLAANLVRDAEISASASTAAAWLDALRLAALVLLVAAATTPSAETIATPKQRNEPRASTPRLAALAIGVLAVPTLVAIRLWGIADRLTLLLALAAIIVIILAVWRIKILVTTVDRQRQVTELVLDSTGDGIVGLDRQGFVLFVNLSARRLLRCREADLIGRRFHDIAHHEHPDGTPFPWHECPMREFVVNGEAALIPDQVYVRRDGTTFPVEMITSPLIVDGAVMGAVMSFRDVSEREAVQELKRQFISVVSHELRTPLTSIKGSLQMLSSGILGPLNEDQQELMTMAVNNSERLGQLVNDILDLERLDAGRMPLVPADVSAVSLAQQAVASMTGAATAADVTLALDEADTDADLTVHVDPNRLVQVLTNLRGNAIKFSTAGTTVTVSATHLENEIRISVADRGRGIPADQLDSVFDRFGQVESGDSRREGGTGLGLAIAQEIVTRSAGRIIVESSMGVGSTFTVVLPCAAPPEAEGDGI
ncbi:MAG: ATP-binding protein [Actinobacteria bacterium]|nr:ATP-binding protein [Actinomycetota bacterium]